MKTFTREILALRRKYFTEANLPIRSMPSFWCEAKRCNDIAK
jgi:hypothetical protein